jgi:hypothetical protein
MVQTEGGQLTAAEDRENLWGTAVRGREEGKPVGGEKRV